MSFDYTRTLATAERLIERFGQVASLSDTSLAIDKITGAPTNTTPAESSITVAVLPVNQSSIRDLDKSFREQLKGLTSRLVYTISALSKGDVITLVNGEELEVQSHTEINPGGTSVLTIAGCYVTKKP